jgi:hypothetical protein
MMVEFYKRNSTECQTGFADHDPNPGTADGSIRLLA